MSTGRAVADTAAMFVRGLPAAARLSLGWLRCIVA
jgi:hypothetical protein